MDNNVKLVLGQTVILKLSSGKQSFVGELHFVRNDRSRIDLKNVRDYQTNESIQGIQRYYNKEIESVVVLAPSSKSDGDDDDNHVSSSTSSPVVASNKHYQLTSDELNEISMAIESAKYFIHPDRSFHEAIDAIRRQFDIGLSVEMLKNGAISLITVSVPLPKQSIYIFDILAFGGYVPRELKSILEAKRPRKIIHNSIEKTLHLKRNYSVQVQSIADTLVGRERKLFKENR